MKVGDHVICKDPQHHEVLDKDKSFKVTAIVPIENTYGICLDGYGDFVFPESIFEIVEEIPPDPKVDILNKLQHWRDEWIQAENLNDYDEQVKCKKYLDFYLDKLLLQKRYDKEAAKGKDPDDAAFIALRES